MKLKIGLLIAVLSVSACASLTPTRETTEGYRIYDLKNVSSLSSLAVSLKSVMQENSDKSVFANGIPASPAPETAARFQLKNPFANATGMGALLAAQNGGFKVPSCEGSPFTASTRDNFDGAENTTFFICLQPYKAGYHLDIYYSFTKTSGGFSPEALGKALAQSVAGDSSQFIPRVISQLEEAAKKSSTKVSLVESYPL